MSVTPVVEVRDLQKSYRSTKAVDGVTFKVSEGEIFGMLGPNGAGKTTTVEILQGLRHSDSGQVSVLGLDPASQAVALRRQIGSQLQEAALPDRIKVWETLDLFSTTSTGRAADWHELLDQWGFGGEALRRFRQPLRRAAAAPLRRARAGQQSQARFPP